MMLVSIVLIICIVALCANNTSGFSYEYVLEDCPTHVDPRIFLADKKFDSVIPNRASQTLPSGFYLAESSIPGAGLGVFSKMFIPKHTWLGEYQGEFLPFNLTHYHFEDNYAWMIHKNGRPAYIVDAKDIRIANWLRYINCPRNLKEENVKDSQCKGRVYYRTTKDIVPGTELFVYYGDQYALFLGIDPKIFEL